MHFKDKYNTRGILWKRLLGFLISGIIIFTSLVMVSCANAVPQELSASEKIWNQQGLRDYDFTLQRQAFAPEDWRGPVNIEVRDGAAVSVTYTSNGVVVTGGKFDDANTIDKLFTMLKNAYTGTGEFEQFGQKADTVDVSYNPQMGYPTNFYIDVSQKIADEEQGYTVTNLVVQNTTGTEGMTNRNVSAAFLEEGPNDPVEMEAFLDDLMVREMEENNIVGAAVSVVKGGGLFFTKGYGYADLEKHLPVDPVQSGFRIGSVTKLFTWTAVMQLAEQGKLDLDVDINTYLDFPIPDTYPQPITLKHLMTHTAGFEDKFYENLVLDVNDAAPVREWLVSHMPARVRPPGDSAAYSNYGTSLAGYIVARVSGQTYDQYIQEHILDALGMVHTSVESSQMPFEEIANAPLGYTYEDGVFEVYPPWWGQLAIVPAGAVQSTATDMARFMIAQLHNGRYSDVNIPEAHILNESTIQQMRTTLYTPDPRLLGNEYGFFEFNDNGQRTIGHSGEAAPFNTLMLLLPDQDLGVFVAYNSEGGGNLTNQHLGFQRAFFDHYYPSPSVEPIQPPADFAERADRFAGSYKLNRSSYTTLEKVKNLFGGTLEVSNPGDGTLLWSTPWGEWKFVEVEPLYFRQLDGPFGLVFQEDDRGNITKMFSDYTPMFAFEKLSWYETLGFNLALVLGCALLFLSIIPVAIIRFVRRRRTTGDSKPVPGGARIAFWIIMGICILNLLFLVGTFLWGNPVPLFGVSLIYKIVLGLGVLSTALTAGAMIYTVLIWKNSYWGTVYRSYYTVITVAAVAFIWFLNNWNLLGWRF